MARGYSGVQAEAYPQGALLCCLLVLASRLMYTGGLWRTVEVGRTPWAGLSLQVEYWSYFDGVQGRWGFLSLLPPGLLPIAFPSHPQVAWHLLWALSAP